MDLDTIYKAQAGNKSAMDQILRRYTPQVVKAARKWRGVDQEDLQQAGLLAVHDAVLAYDHTKGDRWYSYVSICITFKIRNTARYLMSRGFSGISRHPTTTLSHLPLNSLTASIPGTDLKFEDTLTSAGPSPEAVCVQNTDTHIRVRRAVNRLSSKDKELLYLRYLSRRPMTSREVAVVWGVSRQAVSDREARALRALRLSYLRGLVSSW